MIEAARGLLRRRLSPQAFGHYRFYWWLGRSHLTGVVSAFDGQRTPKIHGFPHGETLPLERQLSNINVFSPTKMCRVMTRNGSDKGRFHNYTTVYSALFGKLRNQALRIFELGLGTNNPQIAFSMGLSGRPGASVRGWRDLFPNALVYGADIDRNILFEEDRIKTFYCDQLDENAIRALWSEPSLREGMDIIIDDGLHTFEANVSFLKESLEHLRPRGVYVVEDIHKDTVKEWRSVLEANYSKQFPNHEFALVELPHPYNHADNNMLIVRRPR